VIEVPLIVSVAVPEDNGFAGVFAKKFPQVLGDGNRV